MVRFGVWMMVFGFGSILLQAMDMHFVLLAWADDYQPLFGGALGGLGVIVALFGFGLASSSAD
ncbi:hypothetical protein ACWEVD_29495 [Nocardia thailandica]|uniref:Uncharacterized protein n=1 Tax=Nocardia thailandica TaxID=257275 RepID=A0ABW6PLT7_9NOCA|nr:hypothetical protein [Nocardia thailandica]